MKKKTFHCPKCLQPVISLQTEFFPFCSKLCKMEDLANWAKNGYVVADDLKLDQMPTIKYKNHHSRLSKADDSQHSKENKIKVKKNFIN